MAKRRATSDSDEEDQLENPQASKRARTEDSDDEPQVIESSPPLKREKRQAVKGKGKASRQADDEDDSDEEEVEVEQGDEEDKKFEEENEEKIRAAIEAKRKVHGVSSLDVPYLVVYLHSRSPGNC